MVLVFLGTSARATAEVDVSQRTIDAHVDPLDFGQSFTAGRDAPLSSVRISASASSGGSHVTLRVHEFDRATLTLSPEVLGVGRALEPQFSTQPAWIEVPLVTPVSLSAGRTYAFTIQADDPGGASGWNNYGASFNNVYGAGEFFHGLSGRVGTTSNIRELAFETVVVPEPAALAVLAIAWAPGLTSRRHRKTRAGNPARRVAGR